MGWRAYVSRAFTRCEWLVTNGLGGYASGTVSGAVTRRYHGLLIAALPAPLGRVVMWSHVSEFLRFSDDDVVSLGAEERAGGQLDLKSADYLTEFRLEDGLPVWTYRVRDVVIEKRVLLPHLQNTVHVSYRVISGETPLRLELRPAFDFRHHEAPVDEDPGAANKSTLPSMVVMRSRRDVESCRRCGCDFLAVNPLSRLRRRKFPRLFIGASNNVAILFKGNSGAPDFFELSWPVETQRP